MTELRVGGSYVGATQRSLYCCVMGGGGRRLDVASLALATALRMSSESTGRPGAVIVPAPAARRELPAGGRGRVGGADRRRARGRHGRPRAGGRLARRAAAAHGAADRAVGAGAHRHVLPRVAAGAAAARAAAAARGVGRAAGHARGRAAGGGGARAAERPRAAAATRAARRDRGRVGAGSRDVPATRGRGAARGRRDDRVVGRPATRATPRRSAGWCASGRRPGCWCGRSTAGAARPPRRTPPRRPTSTGRTASWCRPTRSAPPCGSRRRPIARPTAGWRRCWRATAATSTRSRRCCGARGGRCGGRATPRRRPTCRRCWRTGRATRRARWSWPRRGRGPARPRG